MESGPATGGFPGWWLAADDANHNPLNWIGTAPVPTTSSGWTFQSGTYTVPAGIAFVHLYAQLYLPSTAAVLRVDDGFIYNDRTSLTVVQNLDYLPFGELNSSDSGITTHKFTGKERDSETALDYFPVRFYSSAQGRFARPDPGNAGRVLADPQSWNGYAYSRNSPVRYIDPFGSDYRMCAANGNKVARYVALFIDDTHSGLQALQTSQLAAEKFVATAFQPNDHMAIFTDSGTVTLDFTDKKEALHTAIEQIKLQSRRGIMKAFIDCPAITSYQAYVIANNLDHRAKEIAVAEAEGCYCPPPFDDNCRRQQEGFVENLARTVWDQTKSESTTALDVLKIAVQRLAKAPGKRVLVIVSPGFVTGGMEQKTSAIVDLALHGHIVINSLDSEGLITTGESQEGRRVDEGVRAMILPEMMSSAAAATGGQFISNNNDLNASLRELMSVPEVSYVLGFAPPERADDKYHQLKVRLTNGRDYRIQARTGYYAGVPEKEAETAQQRIDHIVAGKDQLEQIPVAVHVSHGVARDGQYPIVVAIRIDAKQLKFAKQRGRNLQQLTFVSVLEDPGGNYVAGKEAVMDLLLTDKTLATYRATGIKATLTFTAPKGSYEVREVVRELVQNRMATSNTPVDCR